MLDRFRIMKQFGNVLVEIRAKEMKQLKRGQIRAGSEEVSLVPGEAAGEPDGQADRQARGVGEVQPADGASVFSPRGFPEVLGVLRPVMGGEVPG